MKRRLSVALFIVFLPLVAMAQSDLPVVRAQPNLSLHSPMPLGSGADSAV
jgi:hypothetical protein